VKFFTDSLVCYPPFVMNSYCLVYGRGRGCSFRSHRDLSNVWSSTKLALFVHVGKDHPCTTLTQCLFAFYLITGVVLVRFLLYHTLMLSSTFWSMWCDIRFVCSVFSSGRIELDNLSASRPYSRTHTMLCKQPSTPSSVMQRLMYSDAASCQ
jgi:hypothetical protein